MSEGSPAGSLQASVHIKLMYHLLNSASTACMQSSTTEISFGLLDIQIS